MPINYLQLQPQIQQYGQAALRANQGIQEKLQDALRLLYVCAQEQPSNLDRIRQSLMDKGRSVRIAIPTDENVDCALDETDASTDYTLLAADGSQIIPDAHEALAVALVNISTIEFTPSSGRAPLVRVHSRFLTDQDGQIVLRDISEARINLERDVEEMRALVVELPVAQQPVIALRDGALELFHEPRQSSAYDQAFGVYLQEMQHLYEKDVVLAGYIDKPRADMVVGMLQFAALTGEQVDLSGLSDLHLFSEILQPGQRTALFELVSPSSMYYQDHLKLHFFYVNVSSTSSPWIARIEAPAWVAGNKRAVKLLQRVVIDQCRLMGARPYPYLLHRAHEEALVGNQEKEKLIERLAHELGGLGLEMARKSHKLSAKGLQTRTRMRK